MPSSQRHCARTSLNRKLITLAAEAARAAGAQVDLAEFREFELPIYDGDLDASSGLPPGGHGTRAASRARGRRHDLRARVQLLHRRTAQNAIDSVSRPADALAWQEHLPHVSSTLAMTGIQASGRRAFRSRAAVRWSSPTCLPCRAERGLR